MNDTLYFPHDYHARHDPKLERVMLTMGQAAVGVYWCLIEMLYEQGGCLRIADLSIYAQSLNTTPELLRTLIDDSKLFLKNKTHFYSKSALKRLHRINEKREIARASANSRWNADAKPTHSKRNASKVKKSKEKKSSIKLTDAEFLEALKTNPVYKDIKIDVELGKMDGWLKANPYRKKTRRFIVNWLNRELSRSSSLPPQPQQQRKQLPSSTCTVCGGTGKIIEGDKAGKDCWCLH
jgi:hypothetical protein